MEAPYSKAVLYYVHDPMCSWCWGFEPVKKQLFSALSDRLIIQCLVGGLAPDSDLPMPKEMQNFLQQTWYKIQQAIPNTVFNFNFWKTCLPRRSTYPSNRAIIAARIQNKKFDSLMTLKIQQAYYLEAKNPSDNSMLIQLASKLNDSGLDKDRFEKDLKSNEVQQLLLSEIAFSRSIGANSFPYLAINKNGHVYPIKLDYNNVQPMLDPINTILNGSSQ